MFVGHESGAFVLAGQNDVGFLVLILGRAECRVREQLKLSFELNNNVRLKVERMGCDCGCVRR